MNCDCAKVIEKLRLEEIMDKYPKDSIEEVKLQNVKINFDENKPVAVTSTDVEVYLFGRVNPIRKKMVHSYCPWCGIKTEVGVMQDAVTTEQEIETKPEEVKNEH